MLVNGRYLEEYAGALHFLSLLFDRAFATACIWVLALENAGSLGRLAALFTNASLAAAHCAIVVDIKAVGLSLFVALFLFWGGHLYNTRDKNLRYVLQILYCGLFAVTVATQCD